MEKFTKKNVAGEAVLPVGHVKILCGGVTGEAIERLAAYESLGMEPVEVKAELDGLLAEIAALNKKLARND
jgi:hypothetical protein